MFFKSQSNKPMQPELVASKDATRPALARVHFDAEKAEVRVTDSYMAAIFPVEVEEGDTSGEIPVEALKASRKPPLASQKGNTSIRLNSHAEVRMAHGEDASAPYVTLPRDGSEYTAPNLEQVWPDDHVRTDFEIGVNAELLAKLAKGMGADVVRLRFVKDANGNPSALRPIMVAPSMAGENEPRGLLMPVRLS